MKINPNNKIPDNYPDILNIISPIGKRQVIRKGDTIVDEGEYCGFFYYVESGLFRTFRCIDNLDVTIGFSFTGDVDTCPYAYINETPSTDTIEALTDSTVLKIYKKDFENLADKTFIRYITEQLLAEYIENLIQRTIHFRINTAEVNYSMLTKDQPVLANQIPLKFIASYLGISKERLSRIRRKSHT